MSGWGFPEGLYHASFGSPCHLSAKRCFLRTCLPLTAPFRAMLLTLRGGPQCLDPRAHGGPVHPKVSYIPPLCFTAQTCIPQGISTFLHYASRRSAGWRYTTYEQDLWQKAELDLTELRKV